MHSRSKIQRFEVLDCPKARTLSQESQISFVKKISAAQFATAFTLRPNLLSWFLGAGASAASGIPTGYAMIRDFKAQIFLP